MNLVIIQNLLWLSIIAGIIFLLRLLRKGKRETIIQELILGIILGNLMLVGIPLFEPFRRSQFFTEISEITIAFFLFRIGFSTSLRKMKDVGLRAFFVASVGVIATFMLGLLCIPLIIPGLRLIQYVFIAAALTTTSVGITAGILKELRKLETHTSQIILGAAIIDDILSLIILSLITTRLNSNLTSVTSIDLGIVKIVLFIVGGVALGKVAAKILPRFLYRIYPRIGTKIIIAFCFFFVFFLGSKIIGISSIVGAFIGGLVLEKHNFIGYKQELHGKQVESTIEWVSARTVPFFFVLTGAQMDLSTLISFQTIPIACGLLIVAVIGKLACGLAAGAHTNRWLVGLGMIPRGEVGLVFANIGLMSNIISPTIFSAIIIVVMITTLTAPVLIQKVA